MVLHVLVLSVGSFAVGTGTFVVTGVLTDITEALSVFQHFSWSALQMVSFMLSLRVECAISQ